MDSQKKGKTEKWNPSTEIDTLDDEDPYPIFQKHHSSPENFSRKTGHDIYASAGVGTQKKGIKEKWNSSTKCETLNDEDPIFQKHHSSPENLSRKTGDDIYTSAGVVTQKKEIKEKWNPSTKCEILNDEELMFFCDSPLEKSRKSEDDIYESVAVDTRYKDKKQSESPRLFPNYSEDGTMNRDEIEIEKNKLIHLKQSNRKRV